MIKIYYQILIVILFNIIYSPFSNCQFIRCGVEDLNPQQVQQLKDSFSQWISNGNRVQEDGRLVTIPIAFHIVRYDNGSANVTDQQINSQLGVLNSSFSNTNLRFVLYSIDRVNNTSWTTHTKGSQKESEMKQALAIDPAHVLNFYTCALSSNLLGYATFPWMYSENSYMNGVVVLYSSFSRLSRTTS